jgi:hypothetical protein
LGYLLLDALYHYTYGSSHELGFEIDYFHYLVDRLFLIEGLEALLDHAIDVRAGVPPRVMLS